MTPAEKGDDRDPAGHEEARHAPRGKQIPVAQRNELPIKFPFVKYFLIDHPDKVLVAKEKSLISFIINTQVLETLIYSYIMKIYPTPISKSGLERKGFDSCGKGG
ncbi:hypothetical protein RKD55_000148 [Rossellomorea marisflavi]